MNYNEIKNCMRLLDEIGINFSSTSEKTLEDAIGEKLDYKVLEQIIENNKVTWAKFDKEDKPQSYRFCAFKTIVTNEYAKTKEKIYQEKTEGFDFHSFIYKVTVKIQENLEDAIVREVQREFNGTFEDIKLDRDFVIEALTREAARRRGE